MNSILNFQLHLLYARTLREAEGIVGAPFWAGKCSGKKERLPADRRRGFSFGHWKPTRHNTKGGKSLPYYTVS
ncbi:hypothetical protein PG291_00120 [Riemerella anatipestifer]|nr:hypothetical protein [Riemerella anatipestifer]